jgi:hypothetical protein
MQFGKDNLNPGEPCFWLDVNGNAASCVPDLNALILVKHDFD